MKGIAFIFPGQGSQAVRMGQDFYQSESAARALLDQADSVLGYPLSQIMFEGPMEQLSQTIYTQPAIFTASMMALAAYREHSGEEPSIVAGHSIGEISALCAAGCLGFTDALRLVNVRAQAMNMASPTNPDGTAGGAMCALLGLDIEEVMQVVAGVNGECYIANDNCPGQTVISGERAAVEAARDAAINAGAKRGVMLAVSGPFHSPYMRPAAEAVGHFLATITFQDATIPVVSNLTAQPTTDARTLKQNLISQIHSPVRWRESAERIEAAGVGYAVEAGNNKILAGLFKRCTPDLPVFPLQNPTDLTALLESCNKNKAL